MNKTRGSSPVFGVRSQGPIASPDETAPCGRRRTCFAAKFCSKPRDPRKGKQPERRQFAPFHEMDARRGIDPIAENRPREFRLPAEYGAAFGEGGFDPGHRALAAAEMIDEDDLAAGLHDTGQLMESRVRLGHDC